MDQKTIDAISKLADRYCEELGRFTVAFFIEDPDRWSQWGSGVLLRVADAHFVITARHVIDKTVPRKDPPSFDPVRMRIGALPSSPQGILLNGHLIQRFVDPYDFALIELKSEDIDILQLDKLFLELGACDVRPVDMKDAYIFLGYPGVDSVTDVAARETSSAIHGYLTVPYDESRGEMSALQFDPEVNVAFDHFPGEMRNYDGTPTGFPNPGGASGCGIWRLNVIGRSASDFDTSRATLAAIFHSTSAQKTSIGTPINLVLAGLKQNRSNLKPIIDETFASP